MLSNEPKGVKGGRPSRTSMPQQLSVLSNEPKGVKVFTPLQRSSKVRPFSALERAEGGEGGMTYPVWHLYVDLSVLSNEPKGVKVRSLPSPPPGLRSLSVLSNEPKGVKAWPERCSPGGRPSFQCSRTSRRG